jgi:hypothetical protein
VGLLAKGQPRPVLTGIFDITQLNEILSEKGLPPIDGEQHQQLPMQVQ